VASTIATIISVWKIRNLLKAKRMGISELELCKRLVKERQSC
jgi:hypothetical protein